MNSQFILLKEQERLLIVLEALDAEKLLNTLERERWTGRKDYSLRGMWVALIAVVTCRQYRGKQRNGKGYTVYASVERVNSRLKELLGLGRITVRGMMKVFTRSLLSLLVMVAAAVGMSQRHRFRELRSLVS